MKPETKKELMKTIIIMGVILGGTIGGFFIFKEAMGTEMPIVVVTTPSMVPNINVGDMLFVKYVPPEDIKSGTHTDLQGDVIVYDTNGVWENPASAPVVHRVVGKTEIGGIWYFTAQGDANGDPDPPGDPDTDLIPEYKIIGVVCGRIPYIGYVKIFLSQTNLAVPLMVIVGILLVISIIHDIKHPEEDEEENKRADVKKGGEDNLGTPPSENKFDMGI